MIIMLCSNANEYMVFQEGDLDAGSQLLRRVSGGHCDKISVMSYDFHLSMVATGCVNGEITLYDFEMSQIIGILNGHNGDITSLTFMAPFPMLMSSSNDCSVCIWGVRPIQQKFLNVCIQRFKNISWDYEKDKPCAV